MDVTHNAEIQGKWIQEIIHSQSTINPILPATQAGGTLDEVVTHNAEIQEKGIQETIPSQSTINPILPGTQAEETLDEGVQISTPIQSSISPTTIDTATQEKGKELQELLRMFRQATTIPLSSFILKTPNHKGITAEKGVEDEAGQEGQKEGRQRKSPRLKGKNSQGKSVIELVQDLVAKKCGIL
jgi:hypothetical protein